MATNVSEDGVVRIIPATAQSLRAEDAGGEALARMLGLAAPAQWPAEFGGPALSQSDA